jgi:hypothetical protein
MPHIHELLQYVRGTMFFFLDSVLSLGEPRTRSHLELMQDFMREALALVFKWMQIFPSLVKHYYEPGIDPHAEYKSHNQAVAYCG